ncbi:hypothetical protein CAEBREN_19004 [Caenorhabditis brenneri]|uniref:Sdz-33 F-box domain-containing protein n=1 Tax=Caenorhabditis brenneri TaxID=135651 RepID=G0MBV9_CAEBE|nr:hypothetical protein CAEBREN_19004 [Caenorhabditis brenneri]
MAKLLIQNFDAVHFEPLIPITLNNLLMMNAQFILSEVPKLSDKGLNMYIRLWLKNRSSKLEYLKLDFYRLLHVPNENQQIRILNENLIFKGVDYIERSRNSRRLFEFSFDFDPSSYSQWKVINGGFDIKRQDGTMCTVLINSNYSSFEMFVWP